MAVEGGEALLTIAAYMDLNPLRAHVCRDPRTYRFCGMGEACAGLRKASQGLTEVMGPMRSQSLSCPEALSAYRHFALDCEGKTNREAQSLATSERYDLSRGELLRCRIRHFTEGLVIGSQAFTREAYEENRSHFGPRRRNPVWPLRGGAWGGLFSLRELRGA